ncbi:MAG TPA: hypothetical protein ENH10_02060, partial [Bacteroidetes bacterium]|nr:hypothetical protein [Bacteroidota bacterium]HEX03925.1 hypothetical protein [Bacteroidota bacterium]
MRQRYLAVVIALLLPVMAVAQVWTEQTIDGDYPGARSVLPADVDGDGDIDVLGAAAFADSIV